MKLNKPLTNGAAIFAAATLIVSAIPTAAHAASWTDAYSTATNSRAAQVSIRAEVLSEVNRVRASSQKCGDTTHAAAPALKLNVALNNAAYLHSKDMAVQDYFSHTSKDGRGMLERIADAGFDILVSGGTAGENIAWGANGGNRTAKDVVAAWMKSPGHCRNIMKAEFKEIGIGAYYIARSGGQFTSEIFWTQNFGTGKTNSSVTDVLTDQKTLATATPKISGTLKVGKTLTAKPGTWTSGTKLTYRWLRDGKKIPNATASTYKLVAADRGKTVSVTVTGTKSGYAKAAKTSAKTKKIAYGTLKTATPKISGTVKVGKTLTAKPGTWTSGTKFSYQWLRDGKKISKATKSTYKLVAADKGKRITVTVKGTKSGYTSVSKTSAKSAKVKS